jgi:undecaprenyl-diphosphatase
MDWWQAAVLGLVEGITEYLPISSTGHLILASSLMGLDGSEQQKSAVDAFNIVVQGGAILAVLGLYWPRVLRMIRGVLGQDKEGFALARNIVIAFLPAAVLGVPLNDWIEEKLFNTWPVLLALVIGAVYMMLLDKYKIHPKRADAENQTGKDITQLRALDALIIGLMQCVAMWPGTSRSMMTITGGVLVGLKPKEAAEFSFLLGLPTLGGACVYKLYKDMTGEGPSMFETLGVTPILIGITVATVSAALAVRWLVGFLNTHGLAPFGWYRLALAAVLGGAIVGGIVSIG